MGQALRIAQCLTIHDILPCPPNGARDVMSLGVLDFQVDAVTYPELAAARIIVTGVALPEDWAVAHALSAQGARLAVRVVSNEIPHLEAGDLTGQSLPDAVVSLGRFSSATAAVRFVQDAVRTLNGVDAMINIIGVDAETLAKCADAEDIEDCVSDVLLPASLMTRVAANRMRTTWTAGSILNILSLPEAANGRAELVANLLRAALATLTRCEATAWSGHAIRINAAVLRPSGAEALDTLETDGLPTLAALALYLASDQARRLSGLVFDAAEMVSGAA